MSGQQIGTVVGGIIGAYFGMPQLGMAIGGLIGGAIDPTKINGPHIGDGQTQTATDGSPIAWVIGTAWVAGCIVQVGKRREVKVKDSGKGGPEVSHYEAHQDFAILICESSETRNSTISQVLMIEQDGKIVYDVRPGSSMLGDSQKYKAHVDFLYGAEDQMPHPTLEAISGVGDTVAYRGSCVAVFKDFNLSGAGDRIPTFRFLVASKSNAESVIKSRNGSFKYKVLTPPDDTTPDYSSENYDDTAWLIGNGGFGTSYTFDTSQGPVSAGTYIPSGVVGRTIWIRTKIGNPKLPLRIHVWPDDWAYMWWNGKPVGNFQPVTEGVVEIPKSEIKTVNVLAAKVVDSIPTGAPIAIFLGVEVAAVSSGLVLLQEIVDRLCLRGGLDTKNWDSSGLSGTLVAGYTIATQSTASDCLLTLLQAYFAYGTEFDGKLHFDFYGQDAQITVDPIDVLEATDANDNAITKTVRNQATEFPRKITVTYYDPDQNYMAVDTSVERSAADVVAIGEIKIAMPVAIDGDTAAQAAQKALKIAYAKLEGTRDYCVPFARSAPYITVCAGEPVLMDGKRWVLDEVDLSTGYVKFSSRYDRQSAYTSNLQVIKGNPPSTPTSRYSGPTTLIPMNLPSLRPQDTYGLYLAAASATGSAAWKGCNVLVSFDDQQTWQSVLTITEGSTLGTVVDNEPSGGEPLVVNVDGTGDLVSATPEQLAANANAFALVNGATAEIGQFETAEQDSDGNYSLTGVSRGLNGTTEVPAVADQQFTMLDSVYFLPIDLSFKGKTIALRAVGFNEVAEDQPVVTIVYNPDTTVIHDGGEVT